MMSEKSQHNDARHKCMTKPYKSIHSPQVIYNSEVQNAQRVALMGIVEKQCGQSFVVGSSGGASSSRLSLLMPRMVRKTAKATMTKLMIVFMNIP